MKKNICIAAVVVTVVAISVALSIFLFSYSFTKKPRSQPDGVDQQALSPSSYPMKYRPHDRDMYCIPCPTDRCCDAVDYRQQALSASGCNDCEGEYRPYCSCLPFASCEMMGIPSYNPNLDSIDTCYEEGFCPCYDSPSYGNECYCDPYGSGSVYCADISPYVSCRSMSYIPCTRRGVFEIGGDWLYWRVFQDSSDFNLNLNSALPPFDGMGLLSISPRFRTGSGYRLFASYLLQQSCWEIDAVFTHIFSHANKNEVFSDPLVLASASIKWDASINFFDLNINRICELNSYSDIAPYLGIRGMWIKEHLNIDEMIAPGETGTSFLCNFCEKSRGFGLEGGINAHMQLFRHLALVGQIGGSLLYTHCKEHQKVISINLSTDTMVTHTSSMRLNPTFDGFIGVQYLNRIYGCPIDIHIGWEQHLIVNINHFNADRHSNFNLQGLTFGGGILF